MPADRDRRRTMAFCILMALLEGVLEGCFRHAVRE